MCIAILEQKQRIVTTAFAISLILYLMAMWRFNTVIKRLSTASFNKNRECILPEEIDPWDPEIVKYLDPTLDPFKNCKPSGTAWTELVEGRLRVTHDLQHGKSCQYRALIPIGESEMQMNNWETINGTVKVFDDFIEVQCLSPGGKILFATIHIQMRNYHDCPAFEVRKKLSQRFQGESRHHPSVLVLVLDSTSSSNAIRALPLTQSELMMNYGAMRFSNLNKIAANSRKTAKAMFAAQRIEEVEYNQVWLKSEVEDDCRKKLPKQKSLYEIFRRDKYATFMGDDWITPYESPWCEAFGGVPTTHYSRFANRFFAFSTQQNWLSPKIENIYSSRPVILRTTYEVGTGDSDVKRFEKFLFECKDRFHFILEHLSRFIEAYDGTAKFAAPWLNLPWHDKGYSYIFHLDKYLVQFFRDHRRELENSFVFLISDHGMRNGPVRETNVGELEDNNPMLLMAVPSFLRNNTQLMSNLRANSRSRLSHFDIYTTLYDILKIAKRQHYRSFDDYYFRELGNAQADRSMSILRPIERDRSCFTMEIPRKYCLCHDQWVQVKNMSFATRKQLADKITYSMNQLIASLGGGSYCAQLTPSQDDNSQLSIRRNANRANFQKIKLTVLPSLGLFEIDAHDGIEDEMLANSTWKLGVHMIMRLNEYFNQGDCVRHLDPALRPLCFCTSATGK